MDTIEAQGLPRGLTSGEAATRLAAEGPNALPARGKQGLWAFVFGVLREPMFLLLIAAAAVYLVLGDFREALVLAASIGLIIAITVVQERRTERALEALRDLSSPRALVVRDGRELRIPGVEVVRGDRVLLREGDRVPADARILASSALTLDESLLTGESVPVEKRAGAADAAGMALSGTLVVRGTASAEVVATGARSELGRIGAMLAVAEGRTRLERETARMVRIFAALGIALCVGVAFLHVLMRGDVLGAVLAGLTLAMAVLPEEFPVVLTVFLALGAMRIARHGVLTRRLPAVEMLGAATVLCTDKTGTLTENRMRVAQVWRDGRWGGAEGVVVELAALACERNPFDPMERAILDTGAAAASWTDPARRYPMAEGFLAVCHAYGEDSSGRAAIKGAPETVLALCDVDDEGRARALAATSEAAARGLRVLAVAEAPRPAHGWPDDPRALAFGFTGLVALADPVRASVPPAIALCRRAGIRVVMITGDHPATALAIARESGIGAGRAATGAELDRLDDAALALEVRDCDVFARVRPEQKLRLVNALRAAGEVVAMTGDGVNDAPALRAADIGVAMGKRGTDVAREAADLVLLEDDFASIVGTVRLGRRIYENIGNAMRFLVAVHVPLAGMALLALVAGWPLFVFPVHVVFLEFVIDPACSLVFEAERSDPRLMERKPRPPGERLFTARTLGLSFALGAGVLAVVAATYGLLLAAAAPESQARAAAFTALVFGNLGLILANRSTSETTLALLRRPNAALWWIVAATLVALAAVLYVPAAAEVFRFSPPPPGHLALAALAGFASVAWYDGLKMWRRARLT